MQKENWFVVIAAILYGLIVFGGQFFANLGFSLYEISLYSVTFTGLILFLIILWKREYWIKKEWFWFFVLYGLVGALLQLTQFGGIVLGVPVAVVALLLYSQPIWTTLLGKLILKEQITRKKILAVLVALAGMVLLLKPWDIQSVGPGKGLISALVAGLLLSLWVIMGRKGSLAKQHYITITFGWAGFSALWLLALWPIVRLLFDLKFTKLSFNYPWFYWLYFLFFVLLALVISNLFFYRGIEKVQASTAGVIMLLEPVSATILAAIFFSQAIKGNVFLGGLLILSANYLIISKSYK